MNEREANIRRMLACLGDHSRFRLVRTLVESERCVTDLAVEVGLSQSCTTRHLQALQREGLVVGTRSGKRVVYRLCSDPEVVRELLGWALELSDHPRERQSAVRARPTAASGGHESGSQVEDPGEGDPERIEGNQRRRVRGDLEDYLL